MLDGTEVLALDGWHATATDGRSPLLAFGSDGSPQTLTRKLAHLRPSTRA